MVSPQRILGLIDIDREPRRPPLLGKNFLGERKLVARISPAPSKGLLGRFVDQFVRPQQTAQRCIVGLQVLTPSGLQAVKMYDGSRLR